MTATLGLAAEEGPQGLQMGAIAKRAGVSKETLYRWWRSKTELVLEALAERGDETIGLPDTGFLSSDLRVFLRATAAALDDTTKRLLRSLAAEAAADPGFAQMVFDRFLARRRAALGELLGRAVNRGELTPSGAATTLDLVYGSLWYRLIFDVASLDAGWADAVAEAIAP